MKESPKKIPRRNLPAIEESFAAQFERGESVIVGVSGGADSMVLLELMARLREPLELSVQAVHVNYGLRGEASRLDEYLVRRRCRALDIFLTVHRATELSPEAANLEERAREIRHEVLRAEAREVGASAIVLGHTLDDQAETILMRLMRGSGLTGLAAMRAREGIIVRPLLKIPRTAIRKYAKERAISYRDDQSNLDLEFTRNRVRYQLLPLLREHFNPAITQTLVQSAELVGEDEQFMDELSETLYRRFVKESSAGVSIASTEFLEFPNALQRRVLRSMLRAVARGKKIGHVRAVELALRALAKNNHGVIFPLGEGLTLERKKGILAVTLQTKHAKENATN